MTDPSADEVRPLLRVRQTRDFTDEPVADADLDAIADAARWSGSSQNTQPWRFVILGSVSLPTLREIAAAGLPQSRSLETATAAIAIVVPEAPGKGIAVAFDEGRAAERMLIAASFLRLGAGVAWLRPEVRAMAAERLALPEGRFARTLVAVGHPSSEGRRPKSPRGKARLPRSETVFYERWGATSRQGAPDERRR